MEASSGSSSSGPAPDVKKQLDELWEEIARKANEHFRQSMPRSIIKLSELLASEDFNLRSGSIGQAPNTAGSDGEEKDGDAPPLKRARTAGDQEEKSGIIPPNKALARMVPQIKEEVITAINIFNSVKLWIQLSIPRIEAGNSFGVDVQTETISELSRAEDAGYSLLEGITKYYVTRAKLVSKAIKHSDIDDYNHSVRELDEKEYSTLDMRNNMAIIYDLLTKNWDRIQKPITTHHMTMF